MATVFMLVVYIFKVGAVGSFWTLDKPLTGYDRFVLLLVSS
jgi:hypothetical protein